MSIKSNLEQLVVIGQWIQSNNWCPATSGNLSTREAESENFWISVSGKYKGELSVDDFIEVDPAGEPVSADRKPSAETLLHGLIYKRFPETHFVLHTHSVYGTVLSQLEQGKALVFNDYELQKAFTGIDTHEGVFAVPVFQNSQDMKSLADEINAHFNECDGVHAFLLAGHGLYTWGETAQAAKRHLEALEFLFECEYKLRLLKKS